MKVLTLLSCGFLAAFFVGLVLWWTLPTPEGVRAAALTRAASQLPVGSTKAQVAALLHRARANADFISTKEQLDYTSEVADNGYTSKDLSGCYVASIFHTSKALIGDCGTYYAFFFDKKGRFLKFTSQDQCIGL